MELGRKIIIGGCSLIPVYSGSLTNDPVHWNWVPIKGKTVEHIAYCNVCTGVVASLEGLKDFLRDGTIGILFSLLTRRENNPV